jgi:hypothetical protein
MTTLEIVLFAVLGLAVVVLFWFNIKLLLRLGDGTWYMKELYVERLVVESKHAEPGICIEFLNRGAWPRMVFRDYKGDEILELGYNGRPFVRVGGDEAGRVYLAAGEDFACITLKATTQDVVHVAADALGSHLSLSDGAGEVKAGFTAKIGEPGHLCLKMPSDPKDDDVVGG